jgi:hypothetical protein
MCHDKDAFREFLSTWVLKKDNFRNVNEPILIFEI